MTNAIKLVKQTFTWSVVVMTVLASMGVAAFVPLTANAAECPTLNAGDLFKVDGVSAVYVLDSSMNAMYFPHAEVFNSWYSDFSGVQVIPNTCVDAYPVGQGVNFRAGARLVKRAISPSVYVVEPGNKTSKIASEAVASALYGANWGSLVRDISDSFWNNYSNSGMELTEMKPHNGQLVSMTGSSDVYLVKGGELVKVDGAVRGDVRTVAKSVFDAATMGSGTVTAASVYANASQGAAGPSTPTPGGTPVVSGGDVTVALSAMTPASATVPVSSTHVSYVTVNVTAGAEDAMVSSMTFTRYGLGSRDNFDRVWLEVDGVPVSNEQSISSDDMVTVSPSYKIMAGKTVAFILVANLKNATGQTSKLDGFRLASASSVEVDGGKVMGSFPISGNLMTYSSYGVGSVTMTGKGSTTTVKVGRDEILGEFSLNYSSTANDLDGKFIYLRLRNSGTGDISLVSDLALYQSGTKASSKTEVFGSYVTFRIDDAQSALKKGSTRNYEIRGTVTGGDDGKTYIFELKNSRDLFVKDTSVGYGAATTISIPGGPATSQLAQYTLDAGQFTVNSDISMPSSMNVAKGAKDLTVLVAKMDLGQPVKVDGLKVYLTGSAINGNSATAVDGLIEKVALWVGDRQITSVNTLSGSGLVSASAVDSGLYYNFNTSFSLKNNDLVKVVVSLKSNPTTATTGTFKFAFSGATSFDTPEYLANAERVSSANRTGTVTSNVLSVVGASLTITRNDGYPSSETFIAGNNEHKLASFLVSPGSADSVKLRTMQFNLSGMGPNSTYFTNLKLKVAGVQVGSTQSLSVSGANGLVTFTNVNHTIARNGQATVELYGTVNTGIANGTSTVASLVAANSVFEDSQAVAVTLGADVPSATLVFNAGAALAVAVDSGTALTKIIVAGSASAADVATFRFTATSGAARVTELRLASVTSSVFAATSTADSQITELTLWKDGVQLGSGKQFQSGLVHFDLGTNAFVVPKDGLVTVTVRAKTGAVTQASQTGLNLRVSLWAVRAETQSNGVALSTVSGLDTSASPAATTANLSVAVGNTMMIHASRPTVAVVAATEKLSNSPKDVIRFTVAADAAKAISWKKITLTVEGQCSLAGGATNDPVRCIGVSSSMKMTVDGTQKTAYFSTSTNKLVVLMDAVETISAGQSKTYAINASLSGFTIENDSVSVKIADTHTSSTPAAYASLTSNVLAWTDNSGAYESLTDAHWMNGYKIGGLDTVAYTLSK